MSSPSTDQYEEIARAAKERDEIVARYEKGREAGAQIDAWEDPTLEVYHVTDRYGFIHEHKLPDKQSVQEAKATQVEVERSQKWLKMLKSWDKYYGGEKMARRVHKGIPNRVRGEVWARLLDVPRFKKEQEGVYEKMKRRAFRVSPHIRQIDLDVNRTYRNHIDFRQRYGTQQKALFNVLGAYSMYNTEVGYCQGMSELAALLLMYMNEEDAFCALSQLFSSKKHGLHGFFIPGFPKLMRFQDHHDAVLKKFLPKLRRYFDKHDIYTNLYSIKWFLQCFLDRVPYTLSLRLWDMFMFEGERLLVAAAYTILKLHRRKLLKMPSDDILQFFQSGLEKDFGYDDDAVVDQIVVSIEELKKANMHLPPKPRVNELPTLPFGLEIQPSIEQIINSRNSESVDEHFKRNPHKGKAGFLKKRGLTNYGTPELTHSQTDNLSMQSSKFSEYSADDRSSYYDTAANSRLSLADFTSKMSMQSSRTSYADGSENDSIGAARFTPVMHEETGSHQVEADQPSRDTTIENLAGELKTPSVHSDYDNLENGINEHGLDKSNKHVDSQHKVQYSTQIPLSKSDSYIKATIKSEPAWVDHTEDRIITQTPVLSRSDTLRLSQAKIQRMKENVLDGDQEESPFAQMQVRKSSSHGNSSSHDNSGSPGRHVSQIHINRSASHHNGYLGETRVTPTHKVEVRVASSVSATSLRMSQKQPVM